ncbi:hypothetical protein NQ314_012376 [Rhamnusium bicolor]|uniref:Uncharacterized protein n=1 Tax=Rhamnusium bicolor TaxID=1586634 RepID=A0AAV8XBW8_9CUCU|nr:hypothetical protein NQ314_012376 [Rhamnusium bicolor]
MEINIKCFRAPYYYLDNPQCSAAALDWNTIPEPDAEHNGPIPVALFARHVQELHADGDIGFSKEYEAIQNDAVNEANSSEHSQHPDNKPKNRYLNIIACKYLWNIPKLHSQPSIILRVKHLNKNLYVLFLFHR